MLTISDITGKVREIRDYSNFNEQIGLALEMNTKELICIFLEKEGIYFPWIIDKKAEELYIEKAVLNHGLTQRTKVDPFDNLVKIMEQGFRAISTTEKNVFITLQGRLDGIDYAAPSQKRSPNTYGDKYVITADGFSLSGGKAPIPVISGKGLQYHIDFAHQDLITPRVKQETNYKPKIEQIRNWYLQTIQRLEFIK